MFICFICGHYGKCAKGFCDVVGNKIYVCSDCLKSRIHRIEFKYRYNKEYIGDDDSET